MLTDARLIAADATSQGPEYGRFKNGKILSRAYLIAAVMASSWGGLRHQAKLTSHMEEYDRLGQTGTNNSADQLQGAGAVLLAFAAWPRIMTIVGKTAPCGPFLVVFASELSWGWAPELARNTTLS